MKFGVRRFSLRDRIAARLSLRRRIRAKLRVPRGYGWVTNPHKAMYRRIYRRTTISLPDLIKKLLK